MIKYILLGIIQGITEFLPVSSTAHLVIAQNILKITGNGLVVTVVLHFATALAVVIFFFKDIISLLRNFKLLVFVLIVNIITFVIFILAKDFFEKSFAQPKLIAIALIVTGVILISTRRLKDTGRDILDITDALLLGLAQGLAIIPGISRSGITISTLLFRKVDRETSFRFSFLASLPAVIAAVLLKAKDINNGFKSDFINLAVGFIFSLLTGIFALWILKLVLRKAKLHYFGYYCILIALFTLLFK